MLAIEALIADLHSTNPDTRLAAAAGLGQYGALNEDTAELPGAISSLIEMLHNDPVRDLRLAAAYSLGAIGRPEAVPWLIAALREATSDRGMQLVIVKALGKIGDPMAEQALIEILHVKTSRCLPIAAAKALKRIGTPQALAAAEELGK